MSKVTIAGDVNGTGVFTIAAPNGNTNRTLTLPDEAGTILTNAKTAPGGLVSIQSFTSSGSYTWTKPADINLIKVYVTGGGGGTHSNAGGNYATGGAGGTSIKIIDVSAITSITLTVGAGGAGNTGGAGGAGGTSSFGTHCSATGAQGGFLGTANGIYFGGGLPGVGVNGVINLNGGGGSRAGSTNVHTQGASSYWGGAGNGIYNTSQGSASVSGTHGGGGGGMYDASALSNGGTGVVLVEEYA